MPNVIETKSWHESKTVIVFLAALIGSALALHYGLLPEHTEFLQGVLASSLVGLGLRKVTDTGVTL